MYPLSSPATYCAVPQRHTSPPLNASARPLVGRFVLVEARLRQRRLGQQILEVQVSLERLAHVDLAVGVPRPFVERPVPAQLEVVAVRVGDVDRLLRPLVRALAPRPP